MRDFPHDVTGYGRGSIELAGRQPVYLEGPVTCLDIRGNTVGGIVRIDRSNVPGIVGTELPANGIDAPPGGVDQLSFLVNVPAGTLKSCAPDPALAVAPFTSGGLVIKDGTAHEKN